MWRTLQRAAPAFVPTVSVIRTAARIPLLHAKARATSDHKYMRNIQHVLLAMAFTPFLYGQAGIITVVAGGGPNRTLKDGDAATNGLLSFPTSVAVDGAGNVFIADGYVRKVNPAGIISSVAGGPNPPASAGAEGIPATTAPVNAKAITLDSAGNLYIAEPTRVRRVNTAGIINTVAGSLTTGYRGD